VKERLRERLIAAGAAVGYPLFYVVCLVVFAAWTFPLDKVRDRIVAGFNESQRDSPGGRELSIGELSSSWVTGLKLSGVRLGDRDAVKDPSKPEGKDDLRIDAVTVRLALLPLLVGTKSVEFQAELFGGRVEGVWKDKGKATSLDVTLDGLDLGQVTPLTQLLEVPVDGTLGGTMKLDLPEGKVTKANGTLTIEAEGVALGDGKASLMGKLPVPKLTLGTFSIDADVKDGTIKVSRLGASGKDVDFLADARIPLRDEVMESQADMNLRFRVNDGYRGKNDSTKALFGAPGSTVPGVLDLDPKVKQSKRADGFYTWHAHGPLGKLDFSPGGTGGPAAGPGGAGGGGPARPKGGT
jgi:type II secretion system protein N